MENGDLIDRNGTYPVDEALPPPTDEELAFVESLAVYFEGLGFARMAGRILAWLLMCDPPEQSAQQIGAALQASQGSVSTNLRLLVGFHAVERFTRPGERRDLYRILPGAWSGLVEARSREYTNFRRLLDQGLALLADHPSERRERLADLHLMYSWLEREFPAFWDRWEQFRAGRLADEHRDQSREQSRDSG